MVQAIEMTDQEKKEMYSLLEKEELIEMIIEANKQIDNLTDPINVYNLEDSKI